MTETATPAAVCVSAGYSLNGSSLCELAAGTPLGAVGYGCAAGWDAVAGDPSTCERTATETPDWDCDAGYTLDAATSPRHCHPDPDDDDDDDDDDDEDDDDEDDDEEDPSGCSSLLGALGSGTTSRSGSWAAGCEHRGVHQRL